jgi:hypothetical protein
VTREIIPLANVAAVRHMLRRSPVSVIFVAPLPMEQFFHAALRPFVDSLPDDIDVGVGGVNDLAALGYALQLNELAVFRGASLLARNAVPRELVWASLVDEGIKNSMFLAWGTQMTNSAEAALRGAPENPGIGRTPRAPHQILAIAEAATPRQIQAAQRRLARLYHPDRLRSLVDAGQLGEDVLEFTENRLAEVNAAASVMQKQHRSR